MVAVAEGRLSTEQAIEALWPDVDPAGGHNRLRTVLHRVQEVLAALGIELHLKLPRRTTTAA